MVGPTGAGKTTVVNLISRFYDIQEGNIYIDGNNIRNVSIESLRMQMGIMTQDNFLFRCSLLVNVRLGNMLHRLGKMRAISLLEMMHGLVVKRLLSRASIIKNEQLLEQSQSMGYLKKQ